MYTTQQAQPQQKTFVALQPKYCIAELIRNKYGELNFKKGLDDLQAHCRIKRKQTITYWLTIQAGDIKEISHFVLKDLLTFFNLQEESQLFTQAHKDLLNLAR